MPQAAWEKLGFAALAVIIFVCTIVVVKWTIDFVTWTSVDSGWAQAIGSIAALAVAIFVMSRQNKHAAKLIVQADRLAALRRASAVKAIIERAHAQFTGIREPIDRAFASPNIQEVLAELRTAASVVSEMNIALAAIPTYELGSYAMAAGTHQMLETSNNFSHALNIWITAFPHISPIEVRATFILLERTAWRAFETYEDGMQEVMD